MFFCGKVHEMKWSGQDVVSRRDTNQKKQRKKIRVFSIISNPVTEVLYLFNYVKHSDSNLDLQ